MIKTSIKLLAIIIMFLPGLLATKTHNQNTEPLFFTNNEVTIYSNVYEYDSLIYVLGMELGQINGKSSLSKFDYNLNLIDKIYLPELLFNPKLKKYDSSYIVTGIVTKETRDTLSYEISDIVEEIAFKQEYLENIVEKEIVYDLEQTKRNNRRSSIKITKRSEEFCSLELDFDFWINDHITLKDDRILLAGRCQILEGWEATTLATLVILDKKKYKLNLFDKNVIAEKIEKAYKKNKKRSIKKLFSKWHKKNNKNTITDTTKIAKITNKFIQDIYPTIIDKENRINDQKQKYIPQFHFMQKTLQVTVKDSFKYYPKIGLSYEELVKIRNKNKEEIIYKGEVENSYSKNIDGRKVVILDDEMISALTIYFAKSNGERDKILKRQIFLEDFAHFKRKHWSGIPKLLSNPIIRGIYFNEDFSQAHLSYKKDHSFITSLFVFKNDKWKFVRGVSSGIQ